MLTFMLLSGAILTTAMLDHRNAIRLFVAAFCSACRAGGGRGVAEAEGGSIAAHVALSGRGGGRGIGAAAVLVIVDPDDGTVKGCAKSAALIQGQQLEQGLFLLAALLQNAVVARAGGRICQRADGGGGIDVLILAGADIRHRPGKARQAEKAVDRKPGPAQELSIGIQNADLFVQLGPIVRHEDRRDAVHILLDGTLQLLSVRTLDGDLVAALQAFVFNLRRHLAVQRDQGQGPVLDHARSHVRLGCDVQLFEAAVHARTQCGRDIVVFGFGQLFVQLADLILHRGHRAQHAGQVQGRDRIALPELRVGRHDDLVDLDPLGNRDDLGVDILDIPGAADPGADAAVGGLFAENLVLVRGHARIDLSAQQAYLTEAAQCDIYLGLFGELYGYEDASGISPTEREYDTATNNHRHRLIFIKQADSRHAKEKALIAKAEQDVVRKSFSNYEELRSAVYASLVRYLEEKEYLRLLPFDTTLNRHATMDDIAPEKVRFFVNLAKAKRNFPIPYTPENIPQILTHLNLTSESGELTNAALLLFAKDPQRFCCFNG